MQTLGLVILIFSGGIIWIISVLCWLYQLTEVEWINTGLAGRVFLIVYWPTLFLIGLLLYLLG